MVSLQDTFIENLPQLTQVSIELICECHYVTSQ